LKGYIKDYSSKIHSVLYNTENNYESLRSIIRDNYIMNNLNTKQLKELRKVLKNTYTLSKQLENIYDNLH
jgi:hypothetical protein